MNDSSHSIKYVFVNDNIWKQQEATIIIYICNRLLNRWFWG